MIRARKPFRFSGEARRDVKNPLHFGLASLLHPAAGFPPTKIPAIRQFDTPIYSTGGFGVPSISHFRGEPCYYFPGGDTNLNTAFTDVDSTHPELGISANYKTSEVPRSISARFYCEFTTTGQVIFAVTSLISGPHNYPSPCDDYSSVLYTRSTGLTFYEVSSNFQTRVTASRAFNANEWVTVTATVPAGNASTPADYTTRFYVNGKLFSTFTIPTGTTPVPLERILTVSRTTGLLPNPEAPAMTSFRGGLAWLTVHDRILSAGEVLRLHREGPPVYTARRNKSVPKTGAAVPDVTGAAVLPLNLEVLGDASSLISASTTLDISADVSSASAVTAIAGQAVLANLFTCDTAGDEEVLVSGASRLESEFALAGNRNVLQPLQIDR